MQEGQRLPPQVMHKQLGPTQEDEEDQWNHNTTLRIVAPRYIKLAYTPYPCMPSQTSYETLKLLATMLPCQAWQCTNTTN